MTRAVEALLDGEAEELTRRVIELAKQDDLTALKLCLDRIAPTRKDAPVAFDLPTIASPSDLPRAMAAILEAASSGDLTPSEAQAFTNMLEAARKGMETAELAERVAALEARYGL